MRGCDKVVRLRGGRISMLGHGPLILILILIMRIVHLFLSLDREVGV